MGDFLPGARVVKVVHVEVKNGKQTEHELKGKELDKWIKENLTVTEVVEEPPVEEVKEEQSKEADKEEVNEENE